MLDGLVSKILGIWLYLKFTLKFDRKICKFFQVIFNYFLRIENNFFRSEHLIVHKIIWIALFSIVDCIRYFVDVDFFFFFLHSQNDVVFRKILGNWFCGNWSFNEFFKISNSTWPLGFDLNFDLKKILILCYFLCWNLFSFFHFSNRTFPWRLCWRIGYSFLEIG